jgi:2-polyprenyl-3-methyl-5-hydroxy-6-metoxy-1,4-benzoquinol methylase
MLNAIKIGTPQQEANMKKSSKFWNRIARKYAAKPVGDEAAYAQKLDKTQSYLKPDMDVLEIGCGTGTTALKLAPFARSILAIDFSETMIDIAKEKAEQESISNVTFACTDITDLMSSSDKKYDMIMAHSVLHLIDNKTLTIQQAFSLLKPGGHFVTSTVCLTGWFKLLKLVWPLMYKLGVFPMVYFFNEEELIEDHRNAGFEIDHKWIPSSPTVFMIANKPASQ